MQEVTKVCVDIMRYLFSWKFMPDNHVISQNDGRYPLCNVGWSFILANDCSTHTLSLLNCSKDEVAQSDVKGLFVDSKGVTTKAISSN